MDFISHQFLLFLSIGGLCFLPGFLILRMLIGKNAILTHWEMFLASFAMSIGLLDFLMILLWKNHLSFSVFSIGFSLFVCIALLGILKRIFHFIQDDPIRNEAPPKEPFLFKKTEGMIFLCILLLTFLFKTIYLVPAAFPTSTDLGHHLYWSKSIAETGSIPQYTKKEIVVEHDKKNPDNGTREILSPPEPIADFIIGEHLLLAAIALFSKSDFISAFPVNILFLINILSLLAYFALALRIGEEIQKKFKNFVPQYFGLIVFFLLGPLYAISSPQAKFVSGGVVGNTFGNFFIPIILLFFLRALREKSPFFMGLAFFFTFTLAYTHHLSTLVLLFILTASILMIVFLHIHSLPILFREWRALILHPIPLSIAFFCILFFFTVAMPTYIETHAVTTAIGTPTKTTRTGLTLSEILSGSGEARSVLGMAGLIIIAFFSRPIKKSAGLLIGWTGILLIMSLRPSLVFLDIPSNRIGSYILFPLSFLAGYTIIFLFHLLKKRTAEKYRTIPMPIVTVFIVILFAYFIGSGSTDNGSSLLSTQKSTDAIQTFSASQFLSERISAKDIILKDHNYLAADAFMKLFFMRDYGFPLSRGYFKRYETPGHEQCSLIMISSPNTKAGEQCFIDTGTDIVVINPLFDRVQFEKSPNFSRVYSSPLIHVYRKTL